MTDSLAYQVPSWYIRGLAKRMLEARSEEESLALIAAYVPESDVLAFEDALELALRRDESAAYELVANEAAQ